MQCLKDIKYDYVLFFQVSGEHNHARDPSAVTAAEMMSNVRKRARDTVQPMPSIFNEMLAETRTHEWDDEVEQVVTKLPTFYAGNVLPIL